MESAGFVKPAVRALAEAQDYAIQNSDYQYEYDYYEPDDSEPPDGSEGD